MRRSQCHRGLVRRFGSTVRGRRARPAVRQGEIYGFLGPNGAGKSSRRPGPVHAAAAQRGTASVAGYDVARASPGGAASGSASLSRRPHSTTARPGASCSTLQGPALRAWMRSQIRTRLGEVLDLVDIGAAIDRRIGTYSGGMKRRLDLAARPRSTTPRSCSSTSPPPGSIRTAGRASGPRCARLNLELGMTIFLTTQYLDEADELADRVGIISSGPPGGGGLARTL